MDKAILSDIHAYWFGDLVADDDFPKAKSEIWFERSDATDAHIRDTFGGHLDEARIASWNLSALSRREAIALVVLLDQFPRNIFRTSGEAFAYDEKARDIARRLVASGPDQFFWIERAFLYLPFEHSEDIADQDRSVMYYAELAVTRARNPARLFPQEPRFRHQAPRPHPPVRPLPPPQRGARPHLHPGGARLSEGERQGVLSVRRWMRWPGGLFGRGHERREEIG